MASSTAIRLARTKSAIASGGGVAWHGSAPSVWMVWGNGPITWGHQGGIYLVRSENMGDTHEHGLDTRTLTHTRICHGPIRSWAHPYILTSWPSKRPSADGPSGDLGDSLGDGCPPCILSWPSHERARMVGENHAIRGQRANTIMALVQSWGTAAPKTSTPPCRCLLSPSLAALSRCFSASLYPLQFLTVVRSVISK